MDWLELVANISAFFGTVLLSAGLLRSTEQIKDEEATYFDSNPFKTHGSLKSQPYYRYGFRLLIIGFSINISFSIAKNITFQQISFISILLVSITIILSGLLMIQWFEKRQENQHRLFKSRLINDNFFIRLRHIFTETKSLLEATIDSAVFDNYKNNIIAELKDRINSIDDIYVSDIRELITDLERSTNFKTFNIFLEDYLKNLKII